MSRYCFLALTIILLVPNALAKCYDPLPAFPPPKYAPGELDAVFKQIEASLNKTFAAKSYDSSFLSVEITTSEKSLWSRHYTARNQSNHGVRTIDGNSLYRIASVTKAFTTLAILQQHAAGNLSLDDTVDKYIPELREPQNGTISWKDITLRTLASQLSGIPREFALGDLLYGGPDPTTLGLPPMQEQNPLRCAVNQGVNCSRQDLLSTSQSQSPVFAPNQKATYSNNNYNLLGLVLENVTGIPYSDYVQANIFDALGMKYSTLDTPEQSQSVIPLALNSWGAEAAVQRATGGIYSSSSDLSRFIRYVLTHYNRITNALNWLAPASYADSYNSFFGMPWEIFRTNDILRNSKRPVTFVTKSGGLQGYTAFIIMVAEYDIGITLLYAGPRNALVEVRDLVTIPLLRAADDIAFKHLNEQYGGTYTSTTPTLNTSLTLSANPTTGLVMTSFISNSTNVLPLLLGPEDTPSHMQLLPTLLYQNETNHTGELWRFQVVAQRPQQHHWQQRQGRGVWDDSWVTDVDSEYYAGRPLTELALYRNDAGRVASVGLSAFRVTLERQG